MDICHSLMNLLPRKWVNGKLRTVAALHTSMALCRAAMMVQQKRRNSNGMQIAWAAIVRITWLGWQQLHTASLPKFPSIFMHNVQYWKIERFFFAVFSVLISLPWNDCVRVLQRGKNVKQMPFIYIEIVFQRIKLSSIQFYDYDYFLFKKNILQCKLNHICSVSMYTYIKIITYSI